MIRAFAGAVTSPWACFKYLNYALWFCRAKDFICSPPIRVPPIRCCILQCISKPAVCILNCVLTKQTAFQNRLFAFFISFRHLKLETNYGTRNHLFTTHSFVNFYFLYSRLIFCTPKSPYILHYKNTALYS